MNFSIHLLAASIGERSSSRGLPGLWDTMLGLEDGRRSMDPGVVRQEALPVQAEFPLRGFLVHLFLQGPV